VTTPTEEIPTVQTVQTLASLIDRHGIDVLDHLDRDVAVPIIGGLQFQGDVAVIPAPPVAGELVPAAGIPVVRGEAGGNTHLLLADGPGVLWAPAPERSGPAALDLGTVTVPPGSVAYIAHPEHAYTGIAPGSYVIRRQREQAAEIRLVAD
jgi:hypothetical protein